VVEAAQQLLMLMKYSGPGGERHAKAASAIVKYRSGTDYRKDIEGTESRAKPGLLARDIMSTPVKTLAGDQHGRSRKIMLRYGHTGMPVVEETMIE
jgi:tRNA nucleotidyltransferase (CCA-adding enzyme)